jgi:hypothetical protein
MPIELRLSAGHWLQAATTSYLVPPKPADVRQGLGRGRKREPKGRERILICNRHGIDQYFSDVASVHFYNQTFSEKTTSDIRK